MVSSLEKSIDVQKATQSFIRAVKRAAHKLPVNRVQLEGDLSLLVSGLWDKLESEITGEFKGQSRLIETGGTSRVVQSDRHKTSNVLIVTATSLSEFLKLSPVPLFSTSLVFSLILAVS